MLLWKQGTFADGSSTSATSQTETRVKEGPDDDTPWHSWPRPQAGFLDFGCGNGLLVHILVSEGYHGHGIDLRARSSWSHYPLKTQDHLHVHALDPLAIRNPEAEIESEEPLSLSLSLTIAEGVVVPFLQRGTFIIANHADELTPWTPVLATLCGASGYLSIPCCAWTFDVKFERPRLREYDAAFFETTTLSESGEASSFIESINLGGDAGSASSSYSAYRIWLAKLSLYCGWKVECEMLRIPSTRNWAIIGRRLQDGEDKLAMIKKARGILDRVKERGIFKSRRPEGKAGDH